MFQWIPLQSDYTDAFRSARLAVLQILKTVHKVHKNVYFTLKAKSRHVTHLTWWVKEEGEDYNSTWCCRAHTCWAAQRSARNTLTGTRLHLLDIMRNAVYGSVNPPLDILSIWSLDLTLVFCLVFSKWQPARFSFCGVQARTSWVSRWVTGS